MRRMARYYGFDFAVGHARLQRNTLVEKAGTPPAHTPEADACMYTRFKNVCFTARRARGSPLFAALMRRYGLTASLYEIFAPFHAAHWRGSGLPSFPLPLPPSSSRQAQHYYYYTFTFVRPSPRQGAGALLAPAHSMSRISSIQTHTCAASRRRARATASTRQGAFHRRRASTA